MIPYGVTCDKCLTEKQFLLAAFTHVHIKNRRECSDLGQPDMI